jgi:hypothetical protein
MTPPALSVSTASAFVLCPSRGLNSGIGILPVGIRSQAGSLTITHKSCPIHGIIVLQDYRARAQS